MKYKVTVTLDGVSDGYEVTADSLAEAVDEATGEKMTEFVRENGSSAWVRIAIETT